MNIIIDDNLIPENLQDTIEKVLTDSYFPWYLSEFKQSTCPAFLVDHFKNITPNIFENFQFVHQFIIDGNYNSEHIDLMLLVTKIAQEKYNLPLAVNRIKANLCTLSSETNRNLHQTPHIDNLSPHTVMIYYVNDSDGDTFLFNEYFDRQNLLNINTLSVLKRIKPKKGRCIIFDGFQLHAGAYPITHNKRIVVNFNFLQI